MYYPILILFLWYTLSYPEGVLHIRNATTTILAIDQISILNTLPTCHISAPHPFTLPRHSKKVRKLPYLAAPSILIHRVHVP